VNGIGRCLTWRAASIRPAILGEGDAHIHLKAWRAVADQIHQWTSDRSNHRAAYALAAGRISVTPISVVQRTLQANCISCRDPRQRLTGAWLVRGTVLISSPWKLVVRSAAHEPD
jgi:hypothetical protein